MQCCLYVEKFRRDIFPYTDKQRSHLSVNTRHADARFYLEHAHITAETLPWELQK